MHPDADPARSPQCLFDVIKECFRLEGISFSFECLEDRWLQVPALPANMHWDEADLEPLQRFLKEAAVAGVYVPCPGLSWSTRPIM